MKTGRTVVFDGLELTQHEFGLLQGAIGAQQRYARRNLDNAKEADAINNWASFCVHLKRVREKVEAAAVHKEGET